MLSAGSEVAKESLQLSLTCSYCLDEYSQAAGSQQRGGNQGLTVQGTALTLQCKTSVSQTHHWCDAFHMYNTSIELLLF